MSKIVFILLVFFFSGIGVKADNSVALTNGELVYSNLNLFKLLIPSYSQWASKRYFRATVIDLGTAWFVSDIISFESIKQSRKESFETQKKIFESLLKTSSYGIENSLDYTLFEPDSFLKYSNELNKTTIYNEYVNSVNLEYRYEQAKNQKYIDLVWLGAISTYSFFDGYGVYNKRKTEDVEPFDAFIKSLILPGWGQITTQSYSQVATIYMLAIGFGGQAYYLNKEVKFLRSTKLSSYRESLALKVIKKRNTFLFYLLGLYAYNLVDAFVEAKLYNVDMDLSYSVYNKNLNFGVKLLF